MAQHTATSVELEVTHLFERLDAMDFAAISATFAEDAQGVDELTGAWSRGRAALDAYFAQLEGTVSDVHSTINDLHTTSWAETGIATFVLEQTYLHDGERQSISAPTSLVFRAEGDGWKLALIHSVPIPDQM